MPFFTKILVSMANFIVKILLDQDLGIDQTVNLCILDIFSCFLAVCSFVSKITFSKYSVRNTII